MILAYGAVCFVVVGLGRLAYILGRIGELYEETRPPWS